MEIRGIKSTSAHAIKWNEHESRHLHGTVVCSHSGGLSRNPAKIGRDVAHRGVFSALNKQCGADDDSLRSLKSAWESTTPC